MANINPKVIDYLMAKFGPEAEAQAQDKYQEAQVNPWLAFASGVGQSIAGKNPDLGWVEQANKRAYDATMGQYNSQMENAAKLALTQAELEKGNETLAQKQNQWQSEETSKADRWKQDQDFKKEVQKTNEELRRQQLENSKYEAESRRLAAEATRDAREQKAQELNAVESKNLATYSQGKLSEQQYNAALKAAKESGNYDPTSASQFIDSADLPNWMKWMRSSESNKVHAAEESWVESFLRDASGAAIPTSERSSYANMFFPRPGDTEEIIANKAAQRREKEKGMLLRSGKQGQQILNKDYTDKGPPINKYRNSATGQVRYVYSDGSQEVVNESK